MADTVTANLGLIKPEPGGSNDTWGTKVNDDLDIIDTAIGDLQQVAGELEDEIGLKANQATTYTKTESDNLLAAKANQATTYTKTEVDSLLSGGGVPSGTVIALASNTAPTGWLKANGAAVSRTTYAALFAAIGTTFGAGNGSTTFNLPDLRGEFVRGWDDARGVDSGRAFGSAQADEFESHTHTGSTNTYTHNHSGVITSSATGSGSSNAAALTTNGARYQIGNTASDSHSHTVTIDATGGAETRPRNVALLYCIKI